MKQKNWNEELEQFTGSKRCRYHNDKFQLVHNILILQ
jgi:hypothetical protein